MISLNKDTLEELEEIRDSLVEVNGIYVSPDALSVIRRNGVDPGYLVACYCEDCATGGMVALIGYAVNQSGSESVHVVLDPVTHRITIYPEFY